MVKVVSGPSFDEDMNPLPPKEDWKDFGSCRCDDNGVMKQISVNGVMYDYNSVSYTHLTLPTILLV